MITMKVLGPGCANCVRLEATAKSAAEKAGSAAVVVKVTDYAEIMKYPILSTPGLVINEKLVCSGRIPSEREIVGWLQAARS